GIRCRTRDRPRNVPGAAPACGRDGARADPRPLRRARRTPHAGSARQGAGSESAVMKRRTMQRTLLVAALPATAPVRGTARQRHCETLRANRQQVFDPTADAPRWVYGVQVIALTSGQRCGVNTRLDFPQGSAIKVAILVELFRQADRAELRLSE